MSSIELSNATIAETHRQAAAAGKRIEVTDARCRGLRLAASPHGRDASTWYLVTRAGAGVQRHKIGDLRDIGLADARKTADAWRVRIIRDGWNPTAERKEKREAAFRNMRAKHGGLSTMKALLAEYYDRSTVGKAKRSAQDARRGIGRVFASLVERPLDGLTWRDFQAAAETYPAPHQASAAVRYLRPVLRWCARAISPDKLPPGASERLETVARLLKPPAKPTMRDRALTDDELKALLPLLWTSTREQYRVILFALLTGTRKNEAAGARWGEVNLERAEWTIPSARMKGKRAHLVPLSREAVDLLHRLRSDEAEPDPETLVFPTRYGNAASNWNEAVEDLQDASGTTAWSIHDTRRTLATWLARRGVQPHIREACLGHVVGTKLERTYNLYDYAAEKRAALTAWGEHLTALHHQGIFAPGDRKADAAAAARIAARKTERATKARAWHDKAKQRAAAMKARAAT